MLHHIPIRPSSRSSPHTSVTRPLCAQVTLSVQEGPHRGRGSLCLVELLVSRGRPAEAESEGAESKQDDSQHLTDTRRKARVVWGYTAGRQSTRLRGRCGIAEESHGGARFPWADMRRWREGSRREAAVMGGTAAGVGRLAEWENTWEGGLGSHYECHSKSL